MKSRKLLVIQPHLSIFYTKTSIKIQELCCLIWIHHKFYICNLSMGLQTFFFFVYLTCSTSHLFFCSHLSNEVSIFCFEKQLMQLTSNQYTRVKFNTFNKKKIIYWSKAEIFNTKFLGPGKNGLLTAAIYLRYWYTLYIKYKQFSHFGVYASSLVIFSWIFFPSLFLSFSSLF